MGAQVNAHDSTIGTLAGERLDRRDFVATLLAGRRTHWWSPVSARRPTTCSPPASATATSTCGAPWAPPYPRAWASRWPSPDKSVVVITGDGEQLMGIGALGTVAVKAAEEPDHRRAGQRPLRRDRHAAQPHQPGRRPGRRSRGFGIARTERVRDIADAERVARIVTAREGTTFAQVLIEPTSRRGPCRRGTARRSRTGSAPRSASTRSDGRHRSEREHCMQTLSAPHRRPAAPVRWRSGSTPTIPSPAGLGGDRARQRTDVDDAVQAAHRAFTTGPWAELTRQRRAVPSCQRSAT